VRSCPGAHMSIIYILFLSLKMGMTKAELLLLFKKKKSTKRIIIAVETHTAFFSVNMRWHVFH
jgi:hypothetical protein